MKTMQITKVAFRLIVVLLAILNGFSPFRAQAEDNAPRPPRQDALISVNIGLDLAGVHLTGANLEDIQASWDVWYEEFGERYGFSPQIIFYEDIRAIEQDFNANKLDIVSTSALNYLRMTPEIEANRDPNIYGVVNGGKKTYQYLVLVRSGSGVSDVKDVQGKTVIIKKDDKTGLFYLNTLLLRNGRAEPDRFFLAIEGAESFSRAVLSVFFQKDDACLTTKAVFETMAELNPQVGKQLIILDRSPELANGIFFFHQHLSQDIKEILVKHLLDLETSVYGRQILMLYKIDRLVQFEPSDLDSIKILLQEYETHTHQQRQ